MDIELFKLYKDSLSTLDKHQLSEISRAVSDIMYGMLIGPTDLTMEEKDFIEKNKMVFAIKAIRSRTGIGLKESKEIADAYRDKVMP